MKVSNDSILTVLDEYNLKAITSALVAIEAALDRLHFLATAIRRASIQSNRYDLSSSNRDSDAYFEQMATLLVRRRFPHAKGTLHEQLGASIAVRRKRLIHRLRHAEKLSFKRERTKSSRPQKNETVQLTLTRQGGHDNFSSPRGMGSAVGATSVTNYSKMDAGKAWNRIRRPPALSTISIGSSVQDVSIEHLYPEPPKFDSSDSQIRVPCQYCRRPLLAVMLRDKDGGKSRYWK